MDATRWYIIVMQDGDGAWYYDAYTPWNGNRASAGAFREKEADLLVRKLSQEWPMAWQIYTRETIIS